MVTFQQLKDARPEVLAQAADVWTKTADSVSDQREALNGNVLTPVSSPTTWFGKGAGAAQTAAKGLVQLTQQSNTSLTSVANSLSKASGKIRDAQRELEELIADPPTGAVIGADGTVTAEPIPTGLAEPLKAVLKVQRKIAVEATKSRIEAILKSADEADQAAAGSLKSAAKKLPTVTAAAASHDAAQQAKEEGTENARKAAALAERILRSEDADPKLVKELTNLLEKNSKNPHFTATFFDEVGAKDSLKLADKISRQGLALEGAAEDGARDFLAGFGKSLANATSDNKPPYLSDEFIKDLNKAGTQKLWPDDPRQDIDDNTYGYEILGLALHKGNYSDHFLNGVSEGIYEFGMNLPPGTLTDHPDAKPFDNAYNLYGPANQNPLNGLMRALDHNPQYAKQFFDTSDHADRIEDLIDKVDPTYGETFGKNLGSALDAASTEAGQDSDAKKIAGNTINKLGSMEDFPPSMRRAASEILEGHIGDAVGKLSKHLPESVGSTFDGTALRETMEQISKESGSYENLHDAALEYTSEKFGSLSAGEHPVSTKLDDMRFFADNSANFLNSLDGYRMEAIKEEYKISDEEYNEWVSRSEKIIDSAGNLTHKVLGPVIDLTTDEIAKELLKDSSGKASDELLTVQLRTEAEMTHLAQRSMWDNQLWDADVPGAAPDRNEFPNLFDPDGQPKKWDQFDQAALDDYARWQNKSGSGYTGDMSDVVSEIGSHYRPGTR